MRSGGGPKFVFDLGRCVGCAACVLACRTENTSRSPKSPTTPDLGRRTLDDTYRPPLRRVLPLNAVRNPGGPTWFLSVACHHCERPACVRACPSGAYRRTADGLVIHDPTVCLGCRYCEMACPFGAPQFQAADGVMAKCDFCQRRVEAGERPACVAACPTDALKMGSAALDGDAFIPGFDDPAGCRPAIGFKLPRGVRGRRLKDLARRLATTNDQRLRTNDPPSLAPDLGRATTRPRRSSGAVNTGAAEAGQRPEPNDQRPTTNNQRPFEEWPLVVFTALAIPAAGLLAAHLLAEFLFGAAALGTAVPALVLMAIGGGLISSLRHLGRPLRAPLALRGTGRSPLSTEIVLAAALFVFALIAMVPGLSPPLRLGCVRACEVVAVGLLAAFGLVYFLPARWPWRTTLVATPVSSGLSVGAMILASTGTPQMWLPAIGLLALDAAVFAMAWRSEYAGLPAYPAIFTRRRTLFASRLVLVNLLPAVLLLLKLPLAATALALAGVFVDRFAFYGLSAVRSTEGAIAALERSIASS